MDQSEDPGGGTCIFLQQTFGLATVLLNATWHKRHSALHLSSFLSAWKHSWAPHLTFLDTKMYYVWTALKRLSQNHLKIHPNFWNKVYIMLTNYVSMCSWLWQYNLYLFCGNYLSRPETLSWTLSRIFSLHILKIPISKDQQNAVLCTFKGLHESFTNCLFCFSFVCAWQKGSCFSPPRGARSASNHVSGRSVCTGSSRLCCWCVELLDSASWWPART